ncbi:MAG: hypothetical protein JO222_10930, partial [Frankiales bacterium]|nr:hypothetical protein [Frankiales bacterium]
MQSRSRKVACLAGATALASVLAACGGSSGSTGTPGSSHPPGGSGTLFQKVAANASGSPVKGGTLNVLGVGDVTYMDPNISYYSIDYSVIREYSRQLYTYKGELGHQTEITPDLATAMPTISSDGLTYKVTIKTGAKWNTSPPRQVTAADAVRGLMATCNPSTPFGGQADYNAFIVGYKTFCDNYGKLTKGGKVTVTPKMLANFTSKNSIAGASVDPSNPLTVVYKLTHPVSFFTQELALPAFSPRPKELDAYLPGSADIAQHTISDGPYIIQSYQPTKSIVMTRNPSWDASTDTVRKAYVDKIVINETGQQDSVVQQLQTNTPSADVAFDTAPNPIVANQLLTQNYANLNVQSEIASNPYIVFNTVSPNNNGALKNVKVRQAISYALNRANLIQDAGGPKLAPPLTHVLPPQMTGGTGGPADKDFYPHSITKAKQLLAQAGVKNLKITFLYRPASDTSKKMFETVQSDLKAAGITVKPRGATPQDYYAKYLYDASKAKAGVWDLTLAGWGPDWYGNGALSFFAPLF